MPHAEATATLPIDVNALWQQIGSFQGVGDWHPYSPTSTARRGARCNAHRHRTRRFPAGRTSPRGWESPGLVLLAGLGGHGESLRRTCGDAAGAEPGSSFGKRTAVNTGSASSRFPAARVLYRYVSSCSSPLGRIGAGKCGQG